MMGTHQGNRPRRLIVTADDFGLCASVNEAVLQAHGQGILTAASLMVTAPAAAQAVDFARRAPHLGVGLHLTLAAGAAALPPERIPGLVDPEGRFDSDPIRAGWRYFANRSLRSQLRAEIHAQFHQYRATGLPLDHLNGHLHLHLHPVVFGILIQDADPLGIRHLRLTADRFWLNTRLARGRWFYRISHGLIFHLLSSRARPVLRRSGIKHTGAVFGLLQDGAVDESYLGRLLLALPGGDSELYSHPSRDQFRGELDALISPRIKAMVERLGIRLMRYQDL